MLTPLDRAAQVAAARAALMAAQALPVQQTLVAAAAGHRN